MGFKKKMFGLLAAIALTFSVAGAAGAVDVGGRVDLNGGACKITATSGGFYFGTWTFDGEKYVPSGNRVSSIDLTIQRAQAKPTCTLSVDTNGLTIQTSGAEDPNNPAPTIGREYFSAAVTQGVQTEKPQDLPHIKQVRNGATTLLIRLDEVPNTYAQGTYSGSFSITIGAGQ